jgi:hypothetical protein
VTDIERLKLCELIIRKIEGRLSSEEAAALNDTLERHQEAIDLYVDFAVLYSSLSKPGEILLQGNGSEGRHLDNLLLELSKAEACAEPLSVAAPDKPTLIHHVHRKRLFTTSAEHRWLSWRCRPRPCCCLCCLCDSLRFLPRA